MKISIASPNAGWVLDEIKNDFKKHTRHQMVNINEKPDIIWIVDPFTFLNVCWKNIVSKMVVSIHHINENKLGEYNFNILNRASACLVPNKITESIVKKYLKIPIIRLPYWLLSKTIKEKNNVEIEKTKNLIGIKNNLLIGSFVKDGNGIDGDTPKLSKGPDMLISILRELKKSVNIKMLLAGYSRKYIINQLDHFSIPYVYLKRHEDVNTLYDCLDWYFVTSICEGGPQSVLEASYRKIKILSTNVGLSPEVLHPFCICNKKEEFVQKTIGNIDKREENYIAVQKYLPQVIIPQLDLFFKRVKYC